MLGLCLLLKMEKDGMRNFKNIPKKPKFKQILSLEAAAFTSNHWTHAAFFTLTVVYTTATSYT